MPLQFTQIEAKPSGLFLALLASGVTTEPADVTVTVDTAGATAGDLTIPITDPGTDIPKNTVLTFDDANSTKVVVTSTFTSGVAGNLNVDTYDGIAGDGIDNDLTSGDLATWDQLYTAVGVESAPFANNSSTQDLNAIVYGGGSTITVSTPNVQSIAPQITVSGLFLAEGQVVQDILSFGDTNRNWWAKHVTPTSTGANGVVREGLAKVLNVSQEMPANDLVRLSYTVQFTSAVPTTTYPGFA